MRAKNALGWGPFSDTLSLIAARRTDKLEPLTSSNENNEVRLSWQEPAYDGGTPLIDYVITIKTNDGDYLEETTYCNGSDFQTRGNLFCLIPMPVLRDAPYSLTLGEIIIGKVSARNAIGYSEESEPNQGFAELRTEPQAPLTLVTRVEEGTTDLTINVSYAELPSEEAEGLSPVTSY